MHNQDANFYKTKITIGNSSGNWFIEFQQEVFYSTIITYFYREILSKDVIFLL